MARTPQVTDVDQIKKDLNDITSRVQTMSGEQVAQLKNVVGEYATAASERVRETTDQVDTYVRENPWRAVTGTLVVGFLAGFILGRSRS